jgi:hypothetical protein
MLPSTIIRCFTLAWMLSLVCGWIRMTLAQQVVFVVAVTVYIHEAYISLQPQRRMET